MSDILPSAQKTCRKCGQTKPSSEFNIRDGYTCKICVRERAKLRTAANRLRNRHIAPELPSLWTWNATKKCRVCKQDKTLDEMKKDVNRIDGYSYICKACHNLLQTNKLKNYPPMRSEECLPRTRTSRLNSRLITFYGITAAQYDAMVVAQNGTCAACGNEETAFDNQGNPQRLSIDHDHKTGKVRELLCTNCNTALGLLHEDPERIKNLLKYLQKHLE